MANTICRIRIKSRLEDCKDDIPTEMRDVSDVPLDTKLGWASKVKDTITQSPPEEYIRPWDFVASMDGSVENVATKTSEDNTGQEYPASYRISPSIIAELDLKEQLQRQESFALGSLLYEIESGRPVYDGLSDDDIQEKFSCGDFPEDIDAMKLGPAMAGYWCLEFAEQLGQLTMGQKATAHIQKSPLGFGLQVAGGLVAVATLAVVPVLGILGFAATGPVVGTAAAAWQSSIGIVQAGSVFAWCQSMAMGGAAAAALPGIAAAGVGVGVAGAGLSATASAPAMGTMPQVPRLKEKLKSEFLQGRALKGKL